MGKLALGRLTPASVWRKIKEEAWFKMENPTEATSTAWAAYDLLGGGCGRGRWNEGQAELRWAMHAVYRQERGHSWRQQQRTINYGLEVSFHFWHGFMWFWCHWLRYHNLRTAGLGNFLPSALGISGFETLPRTLEVKASNELPMLLTDNLYNVWSQEMETSHFATSQITSF